MNALFVAKDVFTEHKGESDLSLADTALTLEEPGVARHIRRLTREGCSLSPAARALLGLFLGPGAAFSVAAQAGRRLFERDNRDWQSRA